eukprot:gene3137-biopygen12700
MPTVGSGLWCEFLPVGLLGQRENDPPDRRCYKERRARGLGPPEPPKPMARHDGERPSAILRVGVSLFKDSLDCKRQTPQAGKGPIQIVRRGVASLTLLWIGKCVATANKSVNHTRGGHVPMDTAHQNTGPPAKPIFLADGCTVLCFGPR